MNCLTSVVTSSDNFAVATRDTDVAGIILQTVSDSHSLTSSIQWREVLALLTTHSMSQIVSSRSHFLTLSALHVLSVPLHTGLIAV